MTGRESGLDAYLPFLQSLLARCPSQFLFGGQAVNFWADFFDRKAHSGDLQAFRPFTSIFLFRSKCHCLLGLDQSARQDARHVRMMALVLPRYLSLLIDGMETENLGERAILREIKLLKKILGTHACRRALGELEIDPGTLIPWAKLDTCGLEALAAFARSHRADG